MRMPKPTASRAVIWPMLPKPIRPSVRPCSSIKRDEYLKPKFPARVARSAAGSILARASIRATACSATDRVLVPGVFTTAMPACVASRTATGSVPVPCTPITRRYAAASTASAGKPSLRVTTATQCLASRAKVAPPVAVAMRGRRPARVSLSRPAGGLAEQSGNLQ